MKMKLVLSYSLLLLMLVVGSNKGLAQVNITSAVTPAQLVQTIVGGGVTYSNITSVCQPTQWGRFTVTSSNLALDSGIILTSGTAATAGINIGANAVPVGTHLSASIGAGAAGGFDACVLQFDFVPTGDSLSFGYVFASQEFLDFSCSTVNDGFAFFLSGPGIAGTPNLALVPGTNIPVCINSVTNPAAVNVFGATASCTAMGPGSPFANLYVNNAFNPTGPLGTPAGTCTINYPGFTHPLLAKHAVIPCSTYHIKLAIEDVGDDIYDSGVFIAANSFKTNGVTLQYNSDLGQGIPYIQRTCSHDGSAIVHITRPHSQPYAQTVLLGYGGSCTRNVDYSPVPDSLVIPIGDSDVSFIIQLLGPPSTTPIQTITILAINPCNGLPTDSIVIPVHNVFPTYTISPDTTVYCGDTVRMMVSGINDSAFVYHWVANPAAVIGNPTDTITYSVPYVNTTYTLYADYSVCHDTIHFNANMQYPQFTINPDTTLYCGNTVSLKLSGDGGHDGGYNYNWVANPPASITSATDTVTTSNPYVTTTYTVTAALNGHCVQNFNFTSNILLPNFTIRPDTTFCAGDQLPMQLYGGYLDPAYQYIWSCNPSVPIIGSTDTIAYCTPQYPTDFTVIASVDGTHCIETYHFHASIDPLPTISITPHDFEFCIHDSIPIYSTTTPNYFTGYSYSWYPTTGFSNPNSPTPNYMAPDTGLFQYVLTVTTPIGCTGRDTLYMHSHNNIKVTCGPDETIHYGESVRLSAHGAMYYTWTPVTTLDNPNWGYPIANPTETTTYTVIGLGEYSGCIDSSHVRVNVIYPDHGVPSVFSPNGDGKNDIFRIVNVKYHKLLEFRVFNRWGEEVFNTLDPEGGWDGTYNGHPADIGTYHYLIRLEAPDGTPKLDVGDVTLIR